MRAYRGHTEGKNFVSKIYCYCPWFLMRWILFSLSNLRAEYNWRAISRTIQGQYTLRFCKQYLQKIMPSYSDFFYMQKINAKCPQISDEKKTSFAPLINNFLVLILKNQKLFVKGAKLFFSSEIWGHFAFTFCRYLKSEYEGIYILQVLPAKSICWCHLILMKKMPFDYD